MENTTSPVISRDGRERVAFLGETVTIRLSAEETGGPLSVMEHDMPRGTATPLHVQPNEDETFYVLDGELTIHLDGSDFTAGAGDVVWFPRGLPHAFQVESETASVLALSTPGGHEAFFRAAGDPVGTPAGAPDFERMARAAAAAGFEILGPPPFGRG
jgi:quercetin dioxygenase-like cupin family protein